jgi:DNA-binding CsgD family transcriptional regulator
MDRANQPASSLASEPIAVASARRFQFELLQTIFDHVPVMICLVDSAGAVKLVNRYWENVLGCSPLEAQLTDVVRDALPDAGCHQEVVRFIANPSPNWRDLKLQLPNDRVIETSWLLVPLSDGTKIGFGRKIVRAEFTNGEGLCRERYFDQMHNDAPSTRLTSRQREVLRLVTEGRRTKEIASMLNISAKTVEAHRSQLMAALGIHDIPGLVRYAIRTGLISADS